MATQKTVLDLYKYKPTYLRDGKSGLYVTSEEVGTNCLGNKIYEAVYHPKDSFGKEVFGLLLVQDGGKEIEDALREVLKNKNCNHVNILEVKDYFYYADHLCVSLPLQEVSSFRYFMNIKPLFRDGYPENCIASILRETIYGLSSIHTERNTHGGLTAEEIFLDSSDGKIKISYGASSFARYSEKKETELSGLPCWTVEEWGGPPESDNNAAGIGNKGDIWFLGIIALELAYGRLKVNNRQQLLGFVRRVRSSQRLPDKQEPWGYDPVETLPNDRRQMILRKLHRVKRMTRKYINPRYVVSRTFSKQYKLVGDNEKVSKKKGAKSVTSFVQEKLHKIPVPGIIKSNISSLSCSKPRKREKVGLGSFSRDFWRMIVDCLHDDPEMRPGFWELLHHYDFFGQCESVDYVVDVVVKQSIAPVWRNDDKPSTSQPPEVMENFC
ncbi:hypothetical protein POM88_024445 [Heracleum sosnowskyi]|uniref:Protein kinase domain-containing protein n=1 Tax=Heracleum sosnowskyi TaxID=360622 RepID=A0AAD8MLG3_9APIA|nr:hypothetical protein POM88_024445 [Heracleum sosnowskyi]